MEKQNSCNAELVLNSRELSIDWDNQYKVKRVKLEGKNQEVNYQYNVLGQRISRIELIDGVANTEYYVHDGEKRK